MIEKVELDGGEVAVAKKRLGVLPDEVEIKAGKKVVGAVAASDCGNERCVGVQECAVEVFEAMADRSSEEERSALKRVGTEARLKTEVAEAIQSFLHAFLVGIGGGREDGDSSAGGSRGRAK
jgi:hypothetical protein